MVISGGPNKIYETKVLKYYPVIGGTGSSASRIPSYQRGRSGALGAGVVLTMENILKATC